MAKIFSFTRSVANIMNSVNLSSSMTFGGLFNNNMAYSAEESSPIPCTTESCCICEEEFSSDNDLANHLLSHADEDVFKAGLMELEKKTPTKHLPANSTPTIIKAVPLKEPLKRTASQRSASPEVWEIISDDSDDESTRNSKSAKLSNSFRLVSTQSTPAENTQVQNNKSNRTPVSKSNKFLVNQPNKTPVNQSNGPPGNKLKRPVNINQSHNLPVNRSNKNTVNQGNGPSVNKSNRPTNVNQSNKTLKQNSQTYKCHTCSAEFKDLNLLKEHVLTHEKEKLQYTCHICKKAFLHKESLRQHLHMHIGEKSHSCKICNKKFTVKSVLRKHELEEHSQPSPQIVEKRGRKSA